MDNFYFLKNAYTPEAVGKYPQVEKTYDGFNVNHPFNLWGFAAEQVQTKATNIILKYHSKLTDYISDDYIVPSEATLLSKKFYNLLQSFQTMPLICVEAEVQHRKKTYPYMYIGHRKGQEQYIDYDKTVFYYNKPGGGWGQEVRIDSYETYLPLMEKTRLEAVEAIKRGEKDTMISIWELHIKENAPDFFVLRTGISGVIVSQRLKDAMENAGITGVLFSPVSEYRPSGIKRPDPS